MGKSFDLSKKSDMRRLEKELNKTIIEQTKQSLLTDTYDIMCPKCKRNFPAKNGKNLCPFCGNSIDVTLEFNF